MKRRALLIGYSGYDLRGGHLNGVSKDLEKYKHFLMSLKGGAWDNSEIMTIKDESLSYVESKIEQIKKENNDMVFSVFTGHGGYDEKKGCRILEISNDITMSETKLWNLAHRQILILDSCSVLSSKSLAEDSKIIASFSNFSISKEEARRLYEVYCLSCPEQQVKLYASEIGTSANDTRNGGAYSYTLLSYLIQQDNYIDIVEAHDKVSEFLARSGQYTDKSVPRVHPFLPGTLNIRA